MSYRLLLATQWRFVGFAFALCFFSSFGQTYFIGVFGGELRAEFGLSHADYGAIYSIATLLSGCSLLVVGRWVDRIDLRHYTLTVTLASALACLLIAVAGSAGTLLLALFLLRLSGQGLMGHIAMTSMGRYFAEHRAKAISLAALGFAAGEALWPRSAFAALDAFHWRELWFTLAAIAFLVTTPLLQRLLRGHSERHARHLAELDSPSLARSDGTATRAQRQWSRSEAIRDLRFYLVLPAALAPAMILTGMFFHQVRIMELSSWSTKLYGNSFILFAAIQVVAGLIAGPFVDRYTGHRLLPALPFPIAVGLAAIAASDAWWACPVYLACLGIAAGATGTITGALWAELYGVTHLGAIRALVTALMVFSTAISPLLMGWGLDLGMTPRGIAIAWIGYVAVATSLAAISLRLRR